LATETKKKLPDTKWKKVKITLRNQDNDLGFIRAGTNDIVIDGKRTMKQYRIKTGEPVELPETLIEQLGRKYEIGLGKHNERTKQPLYFIEYL